MSLRTSLLQVQVAYWCRRVGQTRCQANTLCSSLLYTDKYVYGTAYKMMVHFTVHHVGHWYLGHESLTPGHVSPG